MQHFTTKNEQLELSTNTYLNKSTFRDKKKLSKINIQNLEKHENQRK